MGEQTADLLGDLRVVDLTADRGTYAARLFADLGAEVVHIEWGHRSRGRGSARSIDGIDLGAFVRLAGVEVLVLDPDAPGDRQVLDRLLDGADIALVSEATADSWGTAQSFVDSHPHLVVSSNTPLGLDGPCAAWATTELVEQVMAGFVYRAGVPELPPVAAPSRMAEDMGAVMSVLGAMLALVGARAGGPGQVVDVSSVLSLAHCTDMSLPLFSLFGMVSSRNGAGSYPLHECTDGLARIVLPMSPGEWRSLIAWLGSPPEWTGGEWDQPMLGPAAKAEIDARLPAMFAAGTREELAAQGDAAGVRITPVLSPAEVLDNEHTQARSTFTTVELSPGVGGKVAAPVFAVDGRRGPARSPRTIERAPSWPPRPAPTASVPLDGRPLAGVRVLEIGTGVASPEGARMFGEWGADVIKIESSLRPDFQRTVMGGTMNPAFSTVARGKRAFDVDLTTDEGLALVRSLVAESDVLVENNAAGVLGRLGLGWDVLHEVNPRLVLVSTQLYGDRGPWASKKGYGPSARAVGGLTWLWAHDADSPRGVMTIHPDHLAGRLVAIGALAGLHERERTGLGRRIDIAQFEAVIALLADVYLHESIEPGAGVPRGNVDPRHAPWGLYRCRDEQDGVESWLALCVRDDEDWRALVSIDPVFDQRRWSDEGGRVQDRDALDVAVSSWARDRDAAELESLLQAVSIPASRVLHPRLLVDHPQYVARGWPAAVDQPGSGPLLLEGPAFRGSVMGSPSTAPAPLLGADTDDICRDVLGLDDARIDVLRRSGVLGPRPDAT